MNAIALMLAVAQLVAIESRVGAVVGVSAVDLDTGRAVHFHGADRFPLGSVYKLPIAIAVLRAADRGELNLNQEVTIEPKEFSVGYSPIRDLAKGRPVTMTIGRLVHAMVRESDNTAADYLQKQAGGGAKITKELRAARIEDIRVDRTEKKIAADIDAAGVAGYHSDPRDAATPDAIVALLQKIHRGQEGLSRTSHESLLEMMTNSHNPDRIRGGVPAGTVIAHKTGTMPGVMNDVAILTTADGKHHIAIAILTKGLQSKVDASTIAEIARIVYADLGPLT